MNLFLNCLLVAGVVISPLLIAAATIYGYECYERIRGRGVPPGGPAQ